MTTMVMCNNKVAISILQKGSSYTIAAPNASIRIVAGIARPKQEHHIYI
jgi:hypothetical protein